MIPYATADRFCLYNTMNIFLFNNTTILLRTGCNERMLLHSAWVSNKFCTGLYIIYTASFLGGTPGIHCLHMHEQFRYVLHIIQIHKLNLQIITLGKIYG